MTDFYDAATWQDIPRGARACVYADGIYACPAADAYSRFSAVRFITVRGGTDAAKYAGCLDWEKGNPDFTGSELRDWALGRQDMGRLARVYVQLSNLRQAHDDVDDVHAVRWWVAWWDGPKTAEQVAEASGGLITPELVWAQQYEGDPSGGVDRNVLLSTW
jgi:hypothetical protein